ncbi:AsnC family transcriptional regulator [Embleya sp. NBC_00896]|uniref:Lrp/AsnC family transcriptional regulator n=1 Tax=Embleya sp. NBC_00896 TaxID=2975961 RepID=UPI002F90EF9E|nr:AsnC family transcriptional regulator [Embleya sp. NBC_00896]
MRESKAAHGPDALDELDLALVHALQLAPRATWSGLGPVLGVDPATLARRWRRLEATGAAWITCHPGGPGTLGATSVALVEVQVAPGRIPEVATALARHTHAVNIEYLTGNRDLLITAIAADADALAQYLQVRLPAVPGITGIRVQLPIRLYKDSGSWRLRALDRREREQLATAPLPPASAARGLDDDDRALLLELGPDGRLGTAELARRLGTTGVTVARRLSRLVASGQARFRCEVARSLTGWPVCMTWWLRVPAAELDETAARLTALGDVRMCCAVTGTANLVVVVWLRRASDAPALEVDWSRRFPRLGVLDSAMTIQVVKRMGRVVGPDGHGTGFVPLDIWSDPLAGIDS